MSTVYNLIPHEIISSIGWTLLHSLWQGAVISVILYITLYFMRGKSANTKAIISTCSLLLLFAAAIVTYTIEYNTTSMPGTNTAGFMNETGMHNYITGSSVAGLINGGTNILSNAYSEFKMFFTGNINLIFTLWLAGLFLFAIRLFGGLFYLARIRRKVAIVEDSLWNNRIKDICKKINLKIKISLAESSHTKVPVVIGYFKPVILFPFGLLTGLPAEHIEAILAHEIAHLKRYDLIINLLQSVAEVIFFYNPFVWWISNKIRIEREYCCDDIAIDLCGNELVYAKALVNLESLIESNMPLFAIPLFKNKNQLLRRIKRMLHKNETQNRFKEKFVAAIIFIGILISAAVFKNVNAETSPQNIDHTFAGTIAALPVMPVQPILPSSVDTTVSKRKGTSNFTFTRTENGEEIEYRAKLKDGKLVTLYRDDEKVTEKDFGKYKDMIEEKVREHEANMKKHEENMKVHAANMKIHEENMKQHAINMKKHAENMKIHEANMKIHAENMKKHEIEMKKHNAFMADLKQLLIDEGIIKKGDKDFSMKFNSKRIVVEGEKLSDSIHRKALKLYKEHYNKEMDSENSVIINGSFNSDDDN